MRKIIAIQGYKNSGKDTVAEMVQYLLNTPKIMHFYWMYKSFNKVSFKRNKFHIVKYADKIKEILSLLLNVSIKTFENRDFKENCYVDFTTLTLHWEKDIIDKTKIINDSKFAKEIKRLDMNLTRNYYLSVRQVLQYYGTEIMRHYFGDNIWILSALKSKHKNIIIADQRFKNENIISKQNNAIVLHITRPGCEAGTHASESELKYLEESCCWDVMIDNNSNLKKLFNNCKFVFVSNK